MEQIHSGIMSSAWFLDDKNSGTKNYFTDVVIGNITAVEAMRRIRNSIGRLN